MSSSESFVQYFSSLYSAHWSSKDWIEIQQLHNAYLIYSIQRVRQRQPKVIIATINGVYKTALHFEDKVYRSCIQSAIVNDSET